MKTKILFSTVLFLFVSSVLFAQKQKVVYKVSLHCDACKQKIEKNIAFEKGVKALDVNLAQKTVAVIFDSEKTTSAKISSSIQKLGYEVSVIEQPACCSSESKACCKKAETPTTSCCKAK